MDMFSVGTIQSGSQQTHVAAEHLKCGRGTQGPMFAFYFDLININLNSHVETHWTAHVVVTVALSGDNSIELAVHSFTHSAQQNPRACQPLC